MTREQVTGNFLDAAGWGAADRSALAGDASFRRYERLKRDADVAVLMDASPDHGEDCRPFVAITNLLRGLDLATPNLLAQDLENGLLLLEDLGDDLYARVMMAGADPRPLYEAAVDLLVALHRETEGKSLLDTETGYRVPDYDLAALRTEIDICAQWYLTALSPEIGKQDINAFRDLWSGILPLAIPVQPVLTLRDYHAENLIWLPQRGGHGRVGLLDYQDALMGHRAYDLVSLLEDARRDVEADLAPVLIGRYMAHADFSDAREFLCAYDILGAQRNTKILGIFARLCRRDGKPDYMDMIPRVWTCLERDLSNPVLRPIRNWFDAHIPDNVRAVPLRVEAA